MADPASYWTRFKADELLPALTFLIVFAVVVLVTLVLSALNDYTIEVTTDSYGEFLGELLLVCATIGLGLYALGVAFRRALTLDEGKTGA